jgi:hypothetical protein
VLDLLAQSLVVSSWRLLQWPRVATERIRRVSLLGGEGEKLGTSDLERCDKRGLLPGSASRLEGLHRGLILATLRSLRAVDRTMATLAWKERCSWTR